MTLELAAERLEELARIDPLGARTHDREPAAAEPERVVEPVHDRAEALGELEQHAVRREDADAGVERRQTVDVDQEERQRLARESGPHDLALEHGRERLAVEQVRQHVELGHDVRVLEVECTRDRRAGDADEAVERIDVLFAEAPGAVAGEDAEEALRRLVAEERQDEPDRTGADPSGATRSPENATSIARAPR